MLGISVYMQVTKKWQECNEVMYLVIYFSSELNRVNNKHIL